MVEDILLGFAGLCFLLLVAVLIRMALKKYWKKNLDRNLIIIGLVMAIFSFIAFITAIGMLGKTNLLTGGGMATPVMIISLSSFGILFGIVLVSYGVIGKVYGFIKKFSSSLNNEKSFEREKIPNEDTLTILNKRYAKGEITKEEYEQIKKDIEE